MLANILFNQSSLAQRVSPILNNNKCLSMLNFKGVDKTPDEDVFECPVHKLIKEEQIKKQKRLEQAMKKFGGCSVTKLNQIYTSYAKSQNYDKMYDVQQVLHKLFPKRVEAIESKSLGKINTPMIAQSFLSENESKSIAEYLNHYPYNSKLRQGVYDNSELPEPVQYMDNVISRAPELDEDVIVYRAVAAYDDESLKFINSIKKGKVIEDKSFVSVAKSVDTQFKCFLNRPNSVALRIKLPKGTKGLNINFSEFLLPRNSKIKVVSYDEKYAIADCEYILPENI